MFEKILSIGLLVQIIVAGIAMGYFAPKLTRSLVIKCIGVYFMLFLVAGVVIRYAPFLVDPR